MTPERWQQIDKLVADALDLDPARRKAFLEEACAGDESLRREVESLLAANAQASGQNFLGIPAVKKHADVVGAKAMTDQPMIFNDRYEAIEELGRGGFGVVYLARDLKLLSRLVVVKVLQPRQDGDNRQRVNDYLKRKFHDEIDALTRFRSPHIVSILDQGQTPGGDPFLVMDFIEGGSLRPVMKSQMAFARVADLMRQSGLALSYAHERFVFHRDLKPENMMLRTAEGEDFVIVIDFGIATVKELPGRTRGATPQGWTVASGTPDYMAPEQIRGEPSAASDIWALGVIAYEMLTGRRPFPVPCDNEGNALVRELYQMQEAGVQLKPKELRPDLPEAAQSAILKALSFDPKARHERAQDFTEELAAALTGEKETPRAASPAEDTTTETHEQATVTATTVIGLSPSAEVVISYDSRDLNHALRISEHLQSAGVACWMADRGHEITRNDRAGTMSAIGQCKVVLLLCSDAALRSQPVKQEMQMAWSCERPFLPLLVEPIDFAEQAAYWFEGQQWIEVLNAPPERWLPQLLQSLAQAGVHFHDAEQTTLQPGPVIHPTRPSHGLDSLRSIARFTDQIWPVPAERVERSRARSAVRGLGAPQDDVQHGHRLGSRVSLSLESDRAGHLLLLDEGPEGIIYCLCPSWFAPDPRVQPGRSYLPQKGSRYDAFVVTGKPGREHLLAIVTDEPLGLDWLPSDPKIPARVLKRADVDALLARLRGLEGDRWTALATYFDVVG